MHDFPADAALSATDQYFRQVHHTSPLSVADQATQLHDLQQVNDGLQVVCSTIGKQPCFLSMDSTCLFWMGYVLMLRHNQLSAVLIETHQPLVVRLAKRYATQGDVLEFMDLVQEGNLGLLDALSHYDATQTDTAFSTWAFPWVRGAILRALWKAEHLIRLPARKVRLLRQYDDVHMQLGHELGREPTLREFALALGISLLEMREVQDLHRQQNHILSLDAVVDTGMNEPTTLSDTLAAPSPLPNATTRTFYQAWAQLPDRERLVMTLRLGLDDQHPMTQQEVALAVGASVGTVELLDRRARLRLERLLQQAGVLKQDERLALPA